MSHLEVTTPPEVEPVSLELVKAHVRLYSDLTDDDELLGIYLSSAREFLEGVTARAFVEQTITEVRTVPPGGVLRLNRAPLIELVSVTADGVDITSDVSVRLGGTRLDLGSGYAGSEVVVTYTAGYGDSADDVPAHVKHALLLLVGQAYERREPILAGTIVAELPFALRALIGRMSWGGEVPAR